MSRIYGPHAYSDAPRAECWWDETCDIPDAPALDKNLRCDVAIIGAGFTGLNAALHLAQAGRSVVVLEAKRVGWGASGRNGGFCCLGGSKQSDAALDRIHGRAARLEFHRTEAEAVAYVDDFVTARGIDVDRHSKGETMLAHRPKDMIEFEAEAAHVSENYGVAPQLLDKSELRQHGLGGSFFGALTIPIGFGLNPRKYLRGLRDAAVAAGVQIFEQSPVIAIEPGWTLRVDKGAVSARDVVTATNGYSSEHLPGWLGGRYLPVQSSVIVTRPLTDVELQAQGWTSSQMAYDSRNLLHYFRLMPDRRFLFGMRGGLRSTPRSEAAMQRKVVADFVRMFPAWAQVEATHFWSGMVAVARNKMPYVGPVPDQPGIWVSACYHGNGVGMASLSGRLIADCITKGATVPKAMSVPFARFPLGRVRRLLLPPYYASLALADL